MALGVHRTNCRLSAPGWGTYRLLITDLGHGKNIISSESEARRFKTFYTQVATSGEWYVNALFRSHREYTNFEFWLIGYYNRQVDPNRSPLLPMTVSVESRGFHKVGYPVATVDFGDEFAKVVYPLKINFVSASEPSVSTSLASRYVAPLRESAVGVRMAPGGLQEPGYSAPDHVIGGQVIRF